VTKGKTAPALETPKAEIYEGKNIAKFAMITPGLPTPAALKVPSEITLRKPMPDEWFRTHSSLGYGACLYTPKADRGLSREPYIVTREVAPYCGRLAGEAYFVPATSTLGAVFVIPAVLPDPERPHDAHRTMLEAIEQARDTWTRITWNGSAYDILKFQGKRAEPLWPQELPKLVDALFGRRGIDSIEHEVIQRLIGLA
jgi:hypothetical protein